MPIAERIDCPECGARLVRKPGGRCPECGADVREHVQAEREHETRMEKIAAVASTFLVIALAVTAGGCSLVEGVLAWVAAGALIWWWGKGTFGPAKAGRRNAD